MIKNITQKFIDFNLKISGKIFPEKFNNLLKKFLTVEVVLYIFFGVLTTVVNIGSFAIITSCFKLEENISNAIAIILAVLFAYFTNKDLVFNSKAESFKEKILEFFKFMLGRAFTMVVELIGFYLLFNILLIFYRKTYFKTSNSFFTFNIYFTIIFHNSRFSNCQA